MKKLINQRIVHLVAVMSFIFLLPLKSSSQDSTYVRTTSECNYFNTFFDDTVRYNLLDSLGDIQYARLINFNLLDSNGISSILELTDLFGLDSTYTFIRTNVQNQFDDTTRVFEKYQEYFQGIRVEGGGLTIGKNVDVDGSPQGPCEEVFLAYPFIIDITNMSIGDTIGLSSLRDSLIDYFQDSLIVETEIELIVFPDLKSDSCRLILGYSLVVASEDSLYLVRCNAMSGEVYSIDAAFDGVSILADTELYGEVTLSVLEDSGTKFLASEDSRLFVYDADQDYPDYDLEAYMNYTLPSTTESTKWGNEATTHAYQAFYVFDKVRNVYEEELNLPFDEIRVLANSGSSNTRGAFSVFGSRRTAARFVIHRDYSGDPNSSYDIIGHEMGHTYINEYFLSGINYTSKSIHEGLSDVFGTYVECHLESGCDWTVGDDLDLIDSGNNYYRDLDDYICFDDVVNDIHYHHRGTIIGHWFYLIVNGSSFYHISSLGIEKAINIVNSALVFMSDNQDIEDLMLATLVASDNIYGYCSDESTSIRRAWDRVCVTPPTFPCHFYVQGYNYVCEEDNSLVLDVMGGPPSATYTWTILGRNNTEYSIVGGTSGSNQFIGSKLIIDEFPTFPYYPQDVIFRVFGSGSGLSPAFIINKHVKILDCDHDDPTCDEYYSNQSRKFPNTDVFSFSNDGRLSEFDKEWNEDSFSKPIYFEVYDVLGRRLYSRNVTEYEKIQIFWERYYGQVLLFKYYFEDGSISTKLKICNNY